MVIYTHGGTNDRPQTEQKKMTNFQIGARVGLVINKTANPLKMGTITGYEKHYYARDMRGTWLFDSRPVVQWDGAPQPISCPAYVLRAA